MLNTSQQAQNVVAAANGNKVALEGMTKASKAAELGMKALSIAGNMIATMVVSWVLSEAISWKSTTIALTDTNTDTYYHVIELILDKFCIAVLF